ncbi:MAG: KH domain-containing protein [Thermoplasmatota archaeon]
MTVHLVKIPKERIGALIGPEGKIKSEIEQRAGVHVVVDSESGDIQIDDAKAFEPVLALKVRDVVRSIGRGFSPEKAFRLFQDDTYLDILDLTEYVGKGEKDMDRVRSRLIGTNGKTRTAIEEATGANVSIYGKTVGLLGEIEEVAVAREAVEMIIDGAPHQAVYRQLEKKRKELRLKELGLG